MAALCPGKRLEAQNGRRTWRYRGMRVVSCGAESSVRWRVVRSLGLAEDSAVKSSYRGKQSLSVRSLSNASALSQWVRNECGYRKERCKDEAFDNSRSNRTSNKL